VENVEDPYEGDYVKLSISYGSVEIWPDSIKLSKEDFDEDGKCVRYLTIKNTGNKTLRWRITDLPSWVSVSQMEGELAPQTQTGDIIELTIFLPDDIPSEAKIKVENKNNPLDYATLTINVSGEPGPVADPGGPYEGYVGEYIQFDGSNSYDPSGSSIVEYDWKFNLISFWHKDIGPTPSYRYWRAGIHVIKLRVWNEKDQYDIGTTYANIKTDGSLSLSISTEELTNNKVRFTIEVTNDNSYNYNSGNVNSLANENNEYHYAIDFGDGKVEDKTSGSTCTFEHEYDINGVYLVNVTACNIQTIGSGLASVTVNIGGVTVEPILKINKSSDVASEDNDYKITFDVSKSYDPDNDDTPGAGIVKIRWGYGGEYVTVEEGHISISGDTEMNISITTDINGTEIVLVGIFTLDTETDTIDIWWNTTRGYIKINGSGRFSVKKFFLSIEDLGIVTLDKLTLDVGGSIVINESGKNGDILIDGKFDLSGLKVSLDANGEHLVVKGSFDFSLDSEGWIKISWTDKNFSIDGNLTASADAYLIVENLYVSYANFTLSADKIEAGGCASFRFNKGNILLSVPSAGLSIENLYAKYDEKLVVNLRELNLEGKGNFALSRSCIALDAEIGLELKDLHVSASDYGSLGIGYLSAEGAGSIVLSNYFEADVSGGIVINSLGASTSGFHISLSSLNAGGAAYLYFGSHTEVTAGGGITINGLSVAASGTSLSVGYLSAAGSLSLYMGSYTSIDAGGYLTIISLSGRTSGVSLSLDSLQAQGGGSLYYGSYIQLRASAGLSLNGLSARYSGKKGSIDGNLASLSGSGNVHLYVGDKIDISGSAGLSLSSLVVSGSLQDINTNINIGHIQGSGKTSISGENGKFAIDAAAGTVGNSIDVYVSLLGRVTLQSFSLTGSGEGVIELDTEKFEIKSVVGAGKLNVDLNSLNVNTKDFYVTDLDISFDGRGSVIFNEEGIKVAGDGTVDVHIGHANLNLFGMAIAVIDGLDAHGPASIRYDSNRCIVVDASQVSADHLYIEMGILQIEIDSMSGTGKVKIGITTDLAYYIVGIDGDYNIGEASLLGIPLKILDLSGSANVKLGIGSDWIYIGGTASTDTTIKIGLFQALGIAVPLDLDVGPGGFVVDVEYDMEREPIYVHGYISSSSHARIRIPNLYRDHDLEVSFLGSVEFSANIGSTGRVEVDTHGRTAQIYFTITNLLRLGVGKVDDYWVEWDLTGENKIFNWKGRDEGLGLIKSFIKYTDGTLTFSVYWNGKWYGLLPPGMEASVVLWASQGYAPPSTDEIDVSVDIPVNFTAIYIPAEDNNDDGDNNDQNQASEGNNGEVTTLANAGGTSGSISDDYTFTFYFGDGSIKTVQTSDTTVILDHTYSKIGTFEAKVVVKDGDTTVNDTVILHVHSSKLTVSPDSMSWSYFDRDEKGRLYGSIEISYSQDSTKSVTWRVNETELNSIEWAYDWQFSQDTGTLQPGESVKVDFSFKPKWKEDVSNIDDGYLVVENVEDPYEGDYVKLSISYGSVEIWPDSIKLSKEDFDEDGKCVRYLTIKNTGNKTLRWRITDLPSWVSVSQMEGELAPQTQTGDIIELTIFLPDDIPSEAKIKVENKNNPLDYATLTINVSGEPGPVADPGGPYEGYVGEYIQFDGSNSYDPSGSSIVEYDWKFNLISFWHKDIGPTPSYRYWRAGIHVIKLRVWNEKDQYDIGTTYANIKTDGSLSLSISTEELTNNKVRFTIEVTNDNSYNYNSGNVNSLANENNEYHYAIDFGDGKVEDKTSGSTCTFEHEYDINGVYLVNVTACNIQTIGSGLASVTVNIGGVTVEPILKINKSSDVASEDNDYKITFDVSKSYDPDNDDTPGAGIVKIRWGYGGEWKSPKQLFDKDGWWARFDAYNTFTCDFSSEIPDNDNSDSQSEDSGGGAGGVGGVTSLVDVGGHQQQYSSKIIFVKVQIKDDDGQIGEGVTQVINSPCY